MKYPRVTIITLSDDTFFINVPLFGKEMEEFKEKMSSLSQGKEMAIKVKKDEVSFPAVSTVLTSLNKEEMEEISNLAIKEILKRRN